MNTFNLIYNGINKTLEIMSYIAMVVLPLGIAAVLYIFASMSSYSGM